MNFKKLRWKQSDCKNAGITLIALIITIIVLLILAGVTINMVLGDNGLINKSKNAVGTYENEQAKENKMLSDVEAEMDKYLNGGSSGTPITGAINSTNAASHIGEYIDLGTNLINKTGTTHKADWRIFDADETGVYAILADYLPTATIPTTMKVSETAGAKEVTVSKNADGLKIGWIQGDGANQCADNTEAVATLLTTSNWNLLVSSTSPLRGKITGGPTYGQFVKSWNKVNGTTEGNTLIEETEYNGGIVDNTGIYIIPYETKHVDGMWLSSIAPLNNRTLWHVEDGGYIRGLVCNNDFSLGLRPLVHLTSDINVSGQDANGVWQIAQ